jgi:hypothetical protein
MAQYVMILRRAISITRANRQRKGRALDIETFLGPEMVKRRECHLGIKSREFQGPPLPMARVMDCLPKKHEV